MKSKNLNIGFIGGSQMAEAIIKGLLKSGRCMADNLFIIDVPDSVEAGRVRMQKVAEESL